MKSDSRALPKSTKSDSFNELVKDVPFTKSPTESEANLILDKSLIIKEMIERLPTPMARVLKLAIG
jgi:hypothetical protein